MKEQNRITVRQGEDTGRQIKIHLTAARWRKVHLQSDSFKEGHLITELARMLSTADERVLKRHYKSFSSETYGATTTEQIKYILDQLEVKNDDVIIDLGSGIGQLVTFTERLFTSTINTQPTAKCLPRMISPIHSNWLQLSKEARPRFEGHGSTNACVPPHETTIYPDGREMEKSSPPERFVQGRPSHH
ncbi:hypothetical protein L5515_015713 [Caenorhabditis briggsae]|uniref:Histone-lysine N-methyltransferase, H3 lysine-79 specific n=1 Tax=Caenorhabditis briggsae TaxID=6238 RepID=A0AAE9JAI7_CAEBR|nr:hypothetical protein L5515_015713 [Caenorhabditis briggsae]